MPSSALLTPSQTRMCEAGAPQVEVSETEALVPDTVGPFNDPWLLVEHTGSPVVNESSATGSPGRAAVPPLPPPPPPQPASRTRLNTAAGAASHGMHFREDFTNNNLSFNEH